MLFTVIGTLTHELGHIAVAKYFGKGTRLHYGSMNSYSKERIKDSKFIEMRKIMNDNIDSILKKKNFKRKKHYLELKKYLSKKYPHYKIQSKLITIGGPLQTMLTSFFGLLLLSFLKSKGKKEFYFLDWLGVFLALFALREVFNFVTGIFASIIYHRSNFHGDEFVISRFLGLHEWTIPFLMMFIGILISSYVIFKVIPLKDRLTFIIAGFIGGIVGFYSWFGGLGEFFLP